MGTHGPPVMGPLGSKPAPQVVVAEWSLQAATLDAVENLPATH